MCNEILRLPDYYNNYMRYGNMHDSVSQCVACMKDLMKRHLYTECQYSMLD